MRTRVFVLYVVLRVSHHIQIAGWNPFSLQGIGRLDEVSREFESFHLILMLGAKLRTKQRALHCFVRGSHHWFMQFGWGRGSMSNASAGCSIGFRVSRFRPQDAVRITAPPAVLRGRGGCVDLVQGSLRMRLIVAYFPPRPSPGTQAQLRHWKLTFAELWEWVRREASSAPARI
eukprot:7545959-Pyramimonas_sp.AAC.1